MAVTLDTLKKSIGKKKVKSMAFAWLADYENMAGDTDNALARVDAGLMMYPGDIPGMLVRSKILFQKGNFEECIKECEKVLEKEPFCLSAQKRMGEAYEQLGDENERNKCYRRVHDMDPLGTFWKEEYETVSDVATGVAAGVVAGAAADAMGDADFSMPDLGDVSQESAETLSETATDDASAQQPAEEDSLFSKSLDMDIDAPAEETPSAQAASPFSSFGDEDDPFAALASLGGEDNSVEESAMDSLQQSLNTALSESGEEVGEQGDIPAGEEISGHDVGSAFAEMFGEEDDLDSFDDIPSSKASAPAEPAEQAESASTSPFAQFDLPTSLDDEPEQSAEDSAKNVFGEEVEDKPQSVDSAFNDIFGEDELPEEKPSTPAVPEEKVDLDSWSPEPASEGGLFEKSAPSDMDLGSNEESLELEEPAVEDKPEETLELPEEDKMEDKPQSLDSAFADIFGEDELPEELPPAKPEEKSSDEFDLSNWTPGGAPAEESAEPAQEELAAEEPALDLPADEPALELPAEEPALELPAEEPDEPQPLDSSFADVFGEEVKDSTSEDAAKQSLEGEGIGIDKAFDALFAEEDELPEEHAAPAAEDGVTDKVNAEETAPETAVDASAEEALTESEKEEIDKEVGDAISSLFANGDDLPVEGEKTAAAPTEEDTGAEIEEAPLADAALEADLDKSFSSLFGEDDALEEDVASAAPAGESPTEETTAESPAGSSEQPASDSQELSDKDSLASEFSGAFNQLFNTDDDALDEKPAPSGNKGVDFLMSGDSDDEVSAGLVADPTAPLGKLPPDIDESLNTPTLAEIYFEQGCYDKARDIYKDLASKDPENEAIAKRLAEIEKAYNAKFGGDSNG